MSMSPAMKRYNVRIIWLSLLYGAFLIPAVYAFKHHLLHGAAAWIAAILPALPIIGIFAAMGRYVAEERDEYVRMLLVRQSLWASGFTLSLATVWGFLENFELVGHIDAYFITCVWFVGLGVGAVMNRLTVGAAVQC